VSACRKPGYYLGTFGWPHDKVVNELLRSYLGSQCRARAATALFAITAPTLTLGGGVLLTENNEAAWPLDASAASTAHSGAWEGKQSGGGVGRDLHRGRET
jgi:hypothetical protein